jgi:hypothetical protein
MRKRTTWESGKAHQAATARKADIYDMNQEHPQPTPVEYESGNPDEWAESWHGPGRVDSEYEGGAVKRNEVGFPEFRNDTWDHKDSDKWGRDSKGKYDNQRTAAERKAAAVEKLARAVLHTASDKVVEDQIVDFMSLPNQVIVSTLKRMREASPDSMEPKARYNRAMACTKLAARMLGESAGDNAIETVARAFYAADDKVLKGIIGAVASVRIADDETEEEAEEEEETETSQTMTEKKTSQTMTEKKEPEGEGEGEGITSAEAKEVEQMLTEELGPPPGAPGAQPPVTEAAPVDDLHALFQTTEQPAAPIAASENKSPGEVEISFDGGDDDVHTASKLPGDDDALDRLFSDHEEVKAQRELKAASEQDFQPIAGRTASTNPTKKLGAVQPSKKPTEDTMLEALWDRPGA